jgi:hypothetical protein
MTLCLAINQVKSEGRSSLQILYSVRDPSGGPSISCQPGNPPVIIIRILIMAEPLIKPLKVDIPKTEVDRLKAKLNDTRLPGRSIVPDAGTKYGSYSETAVHHSLDANS